MKILIASTPATGHLNPLLAIVCLLIAEGHEVAFLSGSVPRSRIEGIGATFYAFPAGADFDLRDFDSVVPELKSMAPGPDWLRVAMERVFVDVPKTLEEPTDVDFIADRIKALVKAEKVESAGNLDRWRYSEIRLTGK